MLVIDTLEVLRDELYYEDDPMQEAYYYYYSSLEEGETDEANELSGEL